MKKYVLETPISLGYKSLLPENEEGIKDPNNYDRTIDWNKLFNSFPTNNFFNYWKEKLTTVGFIVSSLGDDTAGVLTLKSENHSLSQQKVLYKNMTDWEVELNKSLVSPYGFEYLREQSHASFLVKLKVFNPESIEETKTLIVNCKPVSHVEKTKGFGETVESKSDLIKAIGQLAKDINLCSYPNLKGLIEREINYGVALFNKFTENFYYVPVYNTAAWVNAGKPGDGSNYHVYIKSLQQAMTIAGKEAAWLEVVKNNPEMDEQTALREAIGLNWVTNEMEYDPLSYLMSTRLVRMITAMKNRNSKLVEKINSEVYKLKKQIFFYPKDDEDQTGTPEEFVKQSKHIHYCRE